MVHILYSPVPIYTEVYIDTCVCVYIIYKSIHRYIHTCVCRQQRHKSVFGQLHRGIIGLRKQHLRLTSHCLTSS